MREFITQIKDASDSAIHGFDSLKEGPLKEFINNAGASLVAITMEAETLLRKHAQMEDKTLTAEQMNRIKLDLDKGLEYMERLHP